MGSKNKNKAAATSEAPATDKPATKAKTEKAPKPEKAKEPTKPKAPGKIQQILNLFKGGMTTKDIAKQFVTDAEGNKIPVMDDSGKKQLTDKESGEPVFETFHPTTISIQVNKFKKANPDLYPPQPPAKTKAQKKAEAAAKKAEEEASKNGAGAEVVTA